MGKEQKGFVVYGDVQAVVDELNDEQAGMLFRAMITYFATGKAPKFDGILKYVWIPIRQQMDRDREKYDAKCEKNRKNIKEYWERTKENERIRTNTNATNTKTNTDTNTKTDKDTKTKTKTKTTTDTNTNVGGGGDYDDEFNIFKLLGGDGIDKVYDEYPNTGGDLIQEVFESVRSKRTVVKNPVAYVLGYAKRVGWDDNADHFDGGGMA